jgi:low affinity Fe/Cu permease
MAESWTARFARLATDWTGSTAAFILALSIVLLWIVTGPLFGFSDTWQLVINTGTTIVTFLMVFLIQRSQNKDSRAVHLKLNELVAVMEGASNQLVNIEDASEKELITLHKHFAKLAKLADEEQDIHRSHSVDEATGRHEAKAKRRRRKKEPDATNAASGSGGHTG